MASISPERASSLCALAVGIIDANIVLLDVEPERGQSRFGQRNCLHGDSLPAASYRTGGKSGMRIALSPYAPHHLRPTAGACAGGVGHFPMVHMVPIPSPTRRRIRPIRHAAFIPHNADGSPNSPDGRLDLIPPDAPSLRG